MNLVTRLVASYRLQFATLRDAKVSDEEKQRVLLKQVALQFRILGLLILSIIAFISPFILYILLENISEFIKPSLLVEIPGILVTFLAVFVYILIKKLNGNLFKK